MASSCDSGPEQAPPSYRCRPFIGQRQIIETQVPQFEKGPSTAFKRDQSGWKGPVVGTPLAPKGTSRFPQKGPFKRKAMVRNALFGAAMAVALAVPPDESRLWERHKKGARGTKAAAN
jgi:hypothetical protein